MRSRWRSTTLCRVLVVTLGLSSIVSAAALAATRALPQQSGGVDLLTQANLQIDGPSFISHVGESAALAGDVNGDGLQDVIVGSTGLDQSDRPSSGGAFVVFGRAKPGAVDLAALGDGGFRIDGAAAQDFAGASVAGAGDVNGDGRADVIVGAWRAGNNARALSGSAFVVFGKASGTAVDLAALGEGGFRIDGAAAGDILGLELAAAGDMNGDGKAEVIVGARRASSGGRKESGAAYIVFGKASGTVVDLASLGNAGFRIDGAAGDEAGVGVSAAGDVNGDGLPDVIVGAWKADSNGRKDTGRAYVVFGKASTTAVDLAALGAGGYRIDGAGVNDSVGSDAGALGDVNGDGRPDLVIGAYNAGYNGRSGSGSAYVVFGKATTVTVDLAALGTSGYRIDGAVAGDLVGSQVAGVGDVNGDGLPDVLVGAGAGDNNGRKDSGSAYVVFGKASTTPVDLATLGTGGLRIDGAAPGDNLTGSSTAAGDVNGDGRPDVVVRASSASNNGRSGSGSVYVVYGFGEPSLAYDPVLGSTGKPLVAQGPKQVARTGEATFSVTPSLPAGLVLDARTGVVSGKPSAAVAGSSFTVTMKDLVGQVTAPLQLSVVQSDTRKPVVTLKATASQRIVKAKALFVATSCDEACILTLSTTVSSKGVKGKVVGIPAVRTLKSARGTSFKVVFSADAQAALASLLARGRTGSAALTLVAKDASGNTTTKKLTVPVRS